MQEAQASNDPTPKQSSRAGWKSFLINAAVIALIFGLYRAYSIYDDRHSIRSTVVATVDSWSQSRGGGHGGQDFHFYIKVTLPDGSKVVAKASPLGPEPPKNGERIELVKIESVLGFTRYLWERPLMTFDGAIPL